MKTIVEFPDQGFVAEEAAEWLIRLDSDMPPSSQELRALSEWLHRSPAHREELESLAALWGRMNVLTELTVPLEKTSGQALHTRSRSANVYTRWPWQRIGLFAVPVVVVLAFGIFLFARGLATDPLIAVNGLYSTAVGQQETTTLPDGSQIILNTNSQVRVDYSGQYRQVHLLQGEALFTVVKSTERPFRVYAGNGRIQAVGTAFSVYLKGTDVEVTVTEGRVALASMDLLRSKTQQSTAGERREGAAPDIARDGEGVESLGTLSAGQVATIRSSMDETAADGVSDLKLVEPIAPRELAERLAWRDGILMFSGDPLEEVVKEVSRYTNLTIEIQDPAIRSMRIGGRFPVGETEVMLAALESNFNLRVTPVGHNRVVISAAGE